MGPERRTGITVMASVLLVFSGLIVGYVGHDLLTPGQARSPAGTEVTVLAPNGGGVGLESKTESAGKERNVLREPVSEATQGNEAGQEKASDRQSAGQIGRIQNPDVWFQEGTADPGLNPADWDGDPNLDHPDDPDLVAEIVAEREAAYHQQLQRMAELGGQDPPAWDLDEDESEDQYVDQYLPEIGEQEAMEIERIDADEQAGDLQASEPEIPVPAGEELPPPTLKNINGLSYDLARKWRQI